MLVLYTSLAYIKVDYCGIKDFLVYVLSISFCCLLTKYFSFQMHLSRIENKTRQVLNNSIII